jgi:DNA helicase HerA-like ATPase
VFDEVYGFLPPHPANPPTKRPLVALLKQARAFGVGVVLATQNPMDLDYRALGNAGVWCIGRLQTDADRARVVEGLTGSGAAVARELNAKLKRLAPRWFLVRDVHAPEGLAFLKPRWSMTWLRGPMTRSELRRATRSA